MEKYYLILLIKYSFNFKYFHSHMQNYIKMIEPC